MPSPHATLPPPSTARHQSPASILSTPQHPSRAHDITPTQHTAFRIRTPSRPRNNANFATHRKIVSRLSLSSRSRHRPQQPDIKVPPQYCPRRNIQSPHMTLRRHNTPHSASARPPALETTQISPRTAKSFDTPAALSYNLQAITRAWVVRSCGFKSRPAHQSPVKCHGTFFFADGTFSLWLTRSALYATIAIPSLRSLQAPSRAPKSREVSRDFLFRRRDFLPVADAIGTLCNDRYSVTPLLTSPVPRTRPE